MLIWAPANLCKGRRAIGGVLGVSRLDVVFHPGRIDRIVGATPVDLRRASIMQVNVVSGSTKNALRHLDLTRLRANLVISTTASEYRLIVNDIELVARLLSSGDGGDP